MAYINGELEEEIFMEQLEEFVKPGEEDLVCQLKRSLYGLKQSGRQWYKKLDQRLQDFGLQPLNEDRCVYIKKREDVILIIVVYVDDLVVATNKKEEFIKIKEDLQREFKIKDLGLLHYCLGIEFKQDPINNSIEVSQRKFIEDTLAKFGMSECKPVSTPLYGKIKLTKQMSPTTKEEAEEMRKTPYQSLIGTLMYLTVATRPDITHAVNLLGQFNMNPGKEHWQSAKRVLRYLQGTSDHGLVYQKTGDCLKGFTDADWGATIDDRSSYTGLVFKLEGAAVTWESKKTTNYCTIKHRGGIHRFVRSC